MCGLFASSGSSSSKGKFNKACESTCCFALFFHLYLVLTKQKLFTVIQIKSCGKIICHRLCVLLSCSSQISRFPGLSIAVSLLPPDGLTHLLTCFHFWDQLRSYLTFPAHLSPLPSSATPYVLHISPVLLFLCQYCHVSSCVPLLPAYLPACLHHCKPSSKINIPPLICASVQSCFSGY